MDIQTYDEISEEGLNVLTQNQYTINKTEEPDGILLRSHPLQEMTFHENLLAIARAGTGMNNIPVDKASERGVVVFNTPGADANAVTELAIAAMIVAVRKMIPANRWVTQLTDENIKKRIEKGKRDFQGSEIRGKTLGVIGLGAIGHLVANSAVKLGMTVYGYDPYIGKEVADRLDRDVHQVKELTELYQIADFISIHVPATHENDHLIDQSALTQVKKSTILLNFVREDLIDPNAVVHALDTNQLSYYLTDFPSIDLINREDCLLFPHLGASTEEAERICALMAAAQLTEFIERGTIRNAVNFPNVEMEMETETRLAIVNRNIPSMINLLVDEIGRHQINIVHFINKSRGKYAYTLIDMDENDADVLRELRDNFVKDENILSTRIIKKAIEENKNGRYPTV